MTLDTYIAKFSKLHPDKNKNTWPATTYHCSPYKPLLLLSVLDQFAEGSIQTNLIEPSSELVKLFSLYCSRVLPPYHRSNLVLPFFYLQTQGFWHILPRYGTGGVANPNGSLNRLRELAYGAKLDDDLYALVRLQPSRDALRETLVTTYFSSDVQPALMDQSVVNTEAYQYSQELFLQAKEKIKESVPAAAFYRPAARDQGFRRAVISAYDHTCAFCGLRVLTSEGHTSADAAHIIPWSETHNDSLGNGMALCKLCHWGFDEGLLAASAKYSVIVSPQLEATYNVPAHLPSLENRTLTLPLDTSFWPDVAALKWHQAQVYRVR